MTPLTTGPLRGLRTQSLMLDDYQDFTYVGAKTGRYRSDIPNYVSLPTHQYRGRTQCKIVTGIPLERRGRCWRMARRNVGDTFSTVDGKLCPSFLGLDKRAFASREAALKYTRKLWPGARVELVSYGLQVTIYQPDLHLLHAVECRIDRPLAKLKRFASIYGFDINRGPNSTLVVDYESRLFNHGA